MEHYSKESEEKKIFSRVKQFIKSNRRTFFKVMMYALLLTLFVQYYLRDYAAEYFKNRSTFTSVTKHQYTLPLPNIIVALIQVSNLRRQKSMDIHLPHKYGMTRKKNTNNFIIHHGIHIKNCPVSSTKMSNSELVLIGKPRKL